MARHPLFALMMGFVFVVGLPVTLCAQETRAESGDKLIGTVQKVDKQKGVIVVAYDKVTRQVIFNESTRFTVLNQPGSLEAVKEGRPVICRGRFDWRDRLVAYRVEVREKEK